MNDYPIPRRVVAIAAHPDDLDFGCAGTLALWARQGAEVTQLLVTSGDKGFEDDRPLEEKQEIREREQRAAAREIGARPPYFLRFPDGEVENTPALRREIVRVLRAVRPDTVLTFDPANLAFDNFYRYHPDHRAVAMAAYDALYPATGNRNFFPELLLEGLEPHKVKVVYFISPQQPDVWIDISSTFDRKVAALRAHASQIKDPEAIAEYVADWARRVGAPKGLPLAESFRRLEVPD
ncbi:MAG TPA: PIG-L deacetylase family protein [Thermodesulfobacteriota bacterium]